MSCPVRKGCSWAMSWSPSFAYNSRPKAWPNLAKHFSHYRKAICRSGSWVCKDGNSLWPLQLLLLSATLLALVLSLLACESQGSPSNFTPAVTGSTLPPAAGDVDYPIILMSSLFASQDKLFQQQWERTPFIYLISLCIWKATGWSPAEQYQYFALLFLLTLYLRKHLTICIKVEWLQQTKKCILRTDSELVGMFIGSRKRSLKYLLQIREHGEQEQEQDCIWVSKPVLCIHAHSQRSAILTVCCVLLSSLWKLWGHLQVEMNFKMLKLLAPKSIRQLCTCPPAGSQALGRLSSSSVRLFTGISALDFS